LYYTVVYFLSL